MIGQLTVTVTRINSFLFIYLLVQQYRLTLLHGVLGALYRSPSAFLTRLASRIVPRAFAYSLRDGK